MDIPPNFDEPWLMFDVALVTENSDGKLLYANKAILATYLTYFRGLFFSGFQETKAGSVKIPCDYYAVQEILRLIYHVNHDCAKGDHRYEIDLLTEIYKAADYLDSATIRDMCIQQLLENPCCMKAVAAMNIQHHETLMEIINNLSTEDASSFLAMDDATVLFSKDDLADVYAAVTGNELPVPALSYATWGVVGDLLDLTNYENPLIDLSKKWAQSDVLIKTKNSDGKKLFSNKTVLTTVSPFFANLFDHNGSSGDSHKFAEIEVDVEYTVMKNILCIIHHCHMKGNLLTLLSDDLIVTFMMFSAAAADNLDIPSIRDLCESSLHEDPDSTHLDVTFILNLKEAKKFLLKNIKIVELLQWVYDGDDEEDEPFVFSDEEGYVIHYMNETKPILSLNEVRIIVERIRDEYGQSDEIR